MCTACTLLEAMCFPKLARLMRTYNSKFICENIYEQETGRTGSVAASLPGVGLSEKSRDLEDEYFPNELRKGWWQSDILLFVDLLIACY